MYALVAAPLSDYVKYNNIISRSILPSLEGGVFSVCGADYFMEIYQILGCDQNTRYFWVGPSHQVFLWGGGWGVEAGTEPLYHP